MDSVESTRLYKSARLPIAGTGLFTAIESEKEIH